MEKCSFQAVLFDLDGTLTNTLDDIADAMNRTLRRHGLPEWETDAYRYMVGNGPVLLSVTHQVLHNYYVTLLSFIVIDVIAMLISLWIQRDFVSPKETASAK